MENESSEEIVDVYWDEKSKHAIVVTSYSAYRYRKPYTLYTTVGEYIDEAEELFEKNRDLFEELRNRATM